MFEMSFPGTKLAAVTGVKVDEADCAVQSATDTEVTCTLGPHGAGQFGLIVTVGGLGRAAGIAFTYTLSVTGVTPTTGKV